MKATRFGMLFIALATAFMLAGCGGRGETEVSEKEDGYGLRLATTTGDFTFESDCAVSMGNAWLVQRQVYFGTSLLFDPPLEVYDAVEKCKYEIGKACLTEYDIFQE